MNDKTGDDFDWIQGSGATSSQGTGPSKDHTTNKATGENRESGKLGKLQKNVVCNYNEF